MTWFRCGGSGIPAALKNRMNAVFNKKFGTAIDYPPEGWPDDVNLMGPLPEGTASGSIANFSDGADRVPVKNVIATIAPNFDGVSSVTETQTGDNLLNFPNFTLNFGLTNSAEVENLVNFPAGQYTITFDIPTNTTTKTVTFVIRNKKGAGATQQAISYISAGSTASKTITFTATMPFNYFYCYMSSSETTGTTITIENIMMVSGATSSTYVSPTAPTTYTAQLGRTVYGATADLVNGEGQELVKKITVSYFTGTWGAVTNGYAYYISDADTTHSTSVVNPIMMQANQLFTYGSVGRNSAPTWQYGGNDGGATVNTFILPSEYDTLTKANNFLSSLETPLEVTLTLATPIDFTFDGQEVNTRLGYNAFWSDQGDTEVTYRADISLALQAVSGSRGLMMATRPAIESTNGDQGSEESTENNIETEGDENAR